MLPKHLKPTKQLLDPFPSLFRNCVCHGILWDDWIFDQTRLHGIYFAKLVKVTPISGISWEIAKLTPITIGSIGDLIIYILYIFILLFGISGL